LLPGRDLIMSIFIVIGLKDTSLKFRVTSRVDLITANDSDALNPFPVEGSLIRHAVKKT
jgi:hypothetical protein